MASQDSGDRTSPRATGRCACGSVSYRVDGPLRDVVNCHCTWCRRTTGHHMAATRALLDDLTIESEATLRWWNSTDEMQYGFCSECGSTVFWRSSQQPESMAITAGTLDKPTGLSTTKAYFTQYASDYHHIDDTVESLDYPDGLGV